MDFPHIAAWILVWAIIIIAFDIVVRGFVYVAIAFYRLYGKIIKKDGRSLHDCLIF